MPATYRLFTRAEDQRRFQMITVHEGRLRVVFMRQISPENVRRKWRFKDDDGLESFEEAEVNRHLYSGWRLEKVRTIWSLTNADVLAIVSLRMPTDLFETVAEDAVYADID